MVEGASEERRQPVKSAGIGVRLTEPEGSLSCFHHESPVWSMQLDSTSVVGHCLVGLPEVASGRAEGKARTGS